MRGKPLFLRMGVRPLFFPVSLFDFSSVSSFLLVSSVLISFVSFDVWRVVSGSGPSPVSLSDSAFSSLFSPEVALNPPLFRCFLRNCRKEEKRTESIFRTPSGHLFERFSELSWEAFLQA